jgi:hypothetical protein
MRKLERKMGEEGGFRKLFSGKREGRKLNGCRAVLRELVCLVLESGYCGVE